MSGLACNSRTPCRLTPNLPTAYLWLGKTELNLKNPRGAYGALNQAVELKPNLTEAQILLGDLLLMAKQLDKAKEKAELALKQEPQEYRRLTVVRCP